MLVAGATGRVLPAGPWLLAAACALSMPAAHAGDLQVTPILLEFAGATSTQVLRVANPGTQPLRAQVRVMAWSQADGAEQLSPTRDLAASPP